MKKFTKCLPVLFALALACPAFADAKDSAQSTMTLTVPPFINITKDDNCVESASATFNDNYTTITLNNAMSGLYTVITNKPGDKVKISATAPTDGGETPALFGTDDKNLKLVLTNTGTGKNQAKSTAISNCKTGAAIADNANAICFSITPTITPDTTSGAKDPLNATMGDDGYGVTYTIDNGKYGFSYVLAKTAETNTFSTHDTDGTYKATLTLSQANP